MEIRYIYSEIILRKGKGGIIKVRKFQDYRIVSWRISKKKRNFHPFIFFLQKREMG